MLKVGICTIVVEDILLILSFDLVCFGIVVVVLFTVLSISILHVNLIPPSRCCICFVQSS